MSFGFGHSVARMWDRPGAVSFDGLDGTAWRVVECDAAGIPGARGPSCLIFFSEGLVRRLWDFPESWRSLTSEELEALMGRI